MHTAGKTMVDGGVSLGMFNCEPYSICQYGTEPVIRFSEK